MKLPGKFPLAQRILLVVGVALACLSSNALAVSPNNDVLAALKVSGTYYVAKGIDGLTAAQLETVMSNIISISSTVVSISGTTVNLPDAAGAAVDLTNILQLLATDAGTPKTLVTAAAGPLTGAVEADFTASSLGTGGTSAIFGQIAAAGATNTLYAAVPTKADATELAALEAALAVAGTNATEYNNDVSQTLLVSDSSSATAQATLVYTAGTKTAIPSFSALGAALVATDGATIGNGGLFLQDYFQKDKVATDQEGMVEGFTAGESPGALLTSGSEIVAGAPSALSAAIRTNIAVGLYTSGTTTTSGTNVDTIIQDVAQGVDSGYVAGLAALGAPIQTKVDGLQATLAADIIAQLGIGSAYYVAAGGALDLADPSAQDADIYAKGVATASTTIISTGAEAGTVAQGAADDFVLTGTGDGVALTGSDSTELALKEAVTEGVISVSKLTQYAPQIVTAVAQQILTDASLNAADLTTILTNYVSGVDSPNSTIAWSPSDTLRGTVLLALTQAASTSSTSAYSTIPAVAAAAGFTEITQKPKIIDAVIAPTLNYFYAVSSTETGATGSNTVATIQGISSALGLDGTAATSGTNPAAIVAGLINGVGANKTLAGYIIQGAATDSTLTSFSDYLTADKFITSVAGYLTTSGSYIADVATGLAGYQTFTPEEVGGDLANGTGSKQTVNIAETLALLYPSQAAAIAGAVTGATPTTALTDANRLAVATGVLSTLQTSSSSGLTYAAAVSGSVAATDAAATSATLAKDKATLAKTVASVAAYSSTASAIADAVAATNGADATFETDDLLIAQDVAGAVSASAVETATSVEQIALGEPNSGAVLTGTTFAAGFQKTNLPAVVEIAYTAAASTGTSGSNGSVLTSGSIGVDVALLASVVTSPAVTGSVAAAVATAATKYTVPIFGSENQTDANNNYSYDEVAFLFGTAGHNASLVKDFGGLGPATYTGNIANSLANDLLDAGTAVSGSAQNQAAAAIAYDLVNAIVSSTYSATTAKYIDSIVEAVVTAQPAASADIFGYAAEAVIEAATGSTTWGKLTDNVSVLQTFLDGLESDVNTAATAADSAQSTAISAALSSVWLSSSNGAGNTITTTFAGGDGTYITADETPVTNL